ncbi:MAG TPA: hypothetical protein DGD08_14290 [Gemmatimonas aurantiaca]|uniref:Cytochrome oxidase subunit II transmembrane region profile domain-containing protein n=2 Tax=Gemmatimonas aurantiaca TaxID=173480 RepID=C1AA23_GEMAT|nr:hypothetical protein [Gemmatimonas aurantiaca]BAH39621.1 hypothetical protein GAU_2579 [Gemmatimonas aurantiaca T-27]HCT58370.1 hypothetical protein [Gemmatimonas aurantiaca]
MSSVASWTLPPGVSAALFWLFVAACVIAQLFILRAVLRTLQTTPASSSVPAPRRAAEIFWAIIPVFGLIAAFWGAWRALP